MIESRKQEKSLKYFRDGRGIVVVVKFRNGNGVKDPSRDIISMESRMRWKSHVRFGSGENLEIKSKDYLSTYTVTVRPVYTKEANAECEQRIHSNAYILNIEGGFMRGISKDFSLCLYDLTRIYDKNKIKLEDLNASKPKYVV